MDFRDEILGRISASVSDPVLLGLSERIGEHTVRFDSQDRGGVESVNLSVTPLGIFEDADGAHSVVSVSGPTWAWSALLAHELPYIAATNGYHGALTVSGDPVVVAWLTPALSRFFS